MQKKWVWTDRENPSTGKLQEPLKSKPVPRSRHSTCYKNHSVNAV